jgi:hypothetical protein
MTAPALLDALKAAANQAAASETAFRRDIALRIKALERERAFAFRRLNLMRAVAAAVTGPEKDDDAVAAGVAALRDEIGWVGASEARTEVLDRFAEVARALRAVVAPTEADAEPPDPLAALDAFEAWYADTHTGPFWALFDQYVPENPVVDF